MSIDRLVEEGNIHSFHATKEEIARSMEIARRDLAHVEKILNDSLDWSYSIAYNAVLQACRAFMFNRGYRPASSESHKVTLAFMQLSVDNSLKTTIDYFDRVRQKRHRVVYDEVGLISEKEAQQLIKTKEFISYIEKAIEQ